MGLGHEAGIDQDCAEQKVAVHLDVQRPTQREEKRLLQQEIREEPGYL